MFLGIVIVHSSQDPGDSFGFGSCRLSTNWFELGDFGPATWSRFRVEWRFQVRVGASMRESTYYAVHDRNHEQVRFSISLHLAITRLALVSNCR